MEKQQTAVEWLEQEIKKLNISIDGATQMSAIRIIEKAKAMEKEQIETAYWDGWQNIPSMKPEQYYKETYGKD